MDFDSIPKNLLINFNLYSKNPFNTEYPEKVRNLVVLGVLKLKKQVKIENINFQLFDIFI